MTTKYGFYCMDGFMKHFNQTIILNIETVSLFVSASRDAVVKSRHTIMIIAL